MIKSTWLRSRWLLAFVIGWLFLSHVNPIEAKIIITEVYPAPKTDENEWIELYNTASDPVSLNHWSLMDQLTTPTIIKQFSGADVIEGQKTLVVSLTKSKLNNSGDGVTLKNGQTEIVDETSFAQVQIGLSWTRQNISSDQFNWQQASAGFFEPVSLSLTPTSKTPTMTTTPSIETTVTPTPTLLATPKLTPSATPSLTPTVTLTPTVSEKPTPSVTRAPTKYVSQTGIKDNQTQNSRRIAQEKVIDLPQPVPSPVLYLPSWETKETPVNQTVNRQNSRNGQSTRSTFWPVISGIIGGLQLSISGIIFYVQKH